MAKTWAEKLANKNPAKVEVLDKPFAGLAKGARLYIATPMLVRRYVTRIPRGRVRTIEQMRASFAKANGADGTCPLTSGIFARIVAEAALDEIKAGAKPDAVAPFWRLIDPASPLAKKLSCGPDYIRRMRAREAA